MGPLCTQPPATVGGRVHHGIHWEPARNCHVALETVRSRFAKRVLSWPASCSLCAGAPPHTGILQQRQAALEGALLAHRSAPVEPVGAHISGDALDELAEKLRRRQAAAEKAGRGAERD